MSDRTRAERSSRAAGEALPPMIQGLMRPESYPHAADDIQLHETHISWVVLAGEHAYKLKKPVNLGFLDFTTRQRRAQDCADEVRLNRRLSPDVYLGLVEIVERDGAFIVSGPGSGGAIYSAGTAGKCSGASGAAHRGACSGLGRPLCVSGIRSWLR